MPKIIKIGQRFTELLKKTLAQFFESRCTLWHVKGTGIFAMSTARRKMTLNSATAAPHIVGFCLLFLLVSLPDFSY